MMEYKIEETVREEGKDESCVQSTPFHSPPLHANQPKLRIQEGESGIQNMFSLTKGCFQNRFCAKSANLM